MESRNAHRDSIILTRNQDRVLCALAPCVVEDLAGAEVTKAFEVFGIGVMEDGDHSASKIRRRICTCQLALWVREVDNPWEIG